MLLTGYTLSSGEITSETLHKMTKNFGASLTPADGAEKACSIGLVK